MKRNWRTYTDPEDGFVYSTADASTRDEEDAVDILAMDLQNHREFIERFRLVISGEQTCAEVFGDGSPRLATHCIQIDLDDDGYVVSTWLEDKFDDVRFTREELLEILEHITAHPELMTRPADKEQG